MTIRFDEAWIVAHGIAQEISQSGTDVILVRDMVGRISFVLDGTAPSDLPQRIKNGIGPFSSTTPVILAETLFDPGSILESSDLVVRVERTNDAGRFATLERTAVGADWSRPEEPSSSRRTTLYGFKGGVGRSTATLMLAKHLATLEMCVLVADLDLESPGVGALLLHEDDLPDHGIVDHLIEAAVDNASDLDLVSRSNLLSGDGNGEVWVAPASGRPASSYDYLAKLNRAYTDLPPDTQNSPRRFGDRLDAAITAVEQQVEERSRKPDVVLLDSRAGIHDIAAVAITQLSDLSLLFAADNPQTWAGYRMLFKQWQNSLSIDALNSVRKRLRMVASMTPPSRAEAYLEVFRDNAQQCFADTLYESSEPDDFEAFNFAPQDPQGPHFAYPILFSSDLVALNPLATSDWHINPLVAAAYNDFLAAATALITEEGT